MGWVEEVETAIVENLEWLLEKCLDEMPWQVGIELCDKDLKYYDTLEEETSFRRNEICITREEFEAGLCGGSQCSRICDGMNHLKVLKGSGPTRDKTWFQVAGVHYAERKTDGIPEIVL